MDELNKEAWDIYRQFYAQLDVIVEAGPEYKGVINAMKAMQLCSTVEEISCQSLVIMKEVERLPTPKGMVDVAERNMLIGLVNTCSEVDLTRISHFKEQDIFTNQRMQ